MKSARTAESLRHLRMATAGILAWSTAFAAFADYQETVLSKNPIGYWRLNETVQPTAATATNSGTLGAEGDGYYVNGATPVTGPLAIGGDTAASFDGFSQKVLVPYKEALNPANEFTVEAWVKPTCIDGYNNSWYRAVVRTGGTKSGGGYQIQFDAGNSTAPGVFKFTLWNSSGSLEVYKILAEPGNILATNNGPWAHLVGTWSSADGLGRIYVNGVELTNRAFNYTPNTTATLRIGAGDLDPSETWGQSFDPGPVGQVAVYDYQLTPVQISAHYENGTNPAPAKAYAALITDDHPVGYWRLNESNIPAQPVATNLGLLGAALNGTYCYASAPGVAGLQSPNYGGLDATNTAVSLSSSGGTLPVAGAVWVPPVNLLKTNQLTITAWIKRNGNQMANATILGRRVASAEKSAFAFGSANQLAYNWDDVATQYNFDSKLKVPNDVWTFAAMVATPNSTVLYLDTGTGLVAATNIVSGTNVWNNAKNAFCHEAFIGPSGAYSGRLYNGSVDELAVFTNALSAADLWDLRTAAYASGLFIAAQPQTRPVMLGGSAPFTCIAGAGTTLLPVSYQLLKDDKPVGPATSSSTLTYGNVQASDLTSNFKIAVNTSSGSVTSSPAGLTRATLPGTYSAVVESYHPAAYYRFKEGSGSTIYDLALAVDGTTSGTAARTLGPQPPTEIGFEAGNEALSFGTAAGYVAAPGTAITTNTVTITAWVNPSSAAQTAFSGLYFSRGVDYAGLHFGSLNDTELALSWNGHYNDRTGVYAYPGIWNFVAVAVASDSARFYCYNQTDGWQTGNIIASFPVRNLSGGATAIGSDPNFLTSRYIKGLLDEVAVFNQTLTFADLEKLAIAGTAVQLSIQPAGSGSYQLGWSYGTLQSANALNGTWSDVEGAAAPAYTYNSGGQDLKFFRVRY